MPPANDENPKVKPPQPSLRRTFYSPIAMDEITRIEWLKEVKKAYPVEWHPRIPFSLGPACGFGFPLLFLCYFPVLIIGNRRNAKSLQAEHEKWTSNPNKWGLLAFNGSLEVSAKSAASQIYNSLYSSAGVKYKAAYQVGDMHVVVAMISLGVESLGMTKVYFFVKPEKANSCTVFCRAYKRLLAPCENQDNTGVDRRARRIIAGLLTKLGMQNVQLERSSQPELASAQNMEYTLVSLKEIAEASSLAEPEVERSLGNLNTLFKITEVAYYFVSIAIIIGLLLLLNYLNKPH